jgi:hypothetical protein
VIQPDLIPVKFAAQVARIEAAAEVHLADINRRGPRDFDEWLFKAESQTCAACQRKTAADCPLAALVAGHDTYKTWQVCVRCDGRQTARLDDGQLVFGNSSPVMVLGTNGSRVATRCDCVVAGKTLGTLPITPEPYRSMCNVQRYRLLLEAEKRVKELKMQGGK